MQYRPEIDGIRALAVLLVVFFHVGLPVFSGGYVGVDVFFLISGFLITSLILKDLEKNTFSLRQFWLRRARRILPSLFLVILSSVILFGFVFSPLRYKKFALQILSQLFFSSNAYFWLGTNYFSQDAHIKPLLHTWSLSIEEQFYLVFPLLLILSNRIALRKHFLLFVWITSLLLSVGLTKHWPSFSFYMLPTRAWELGLGSLLAFYLPSHSALKLKPSRAAGIALVGLMAILYSAFSFSKETPFPSYFALVPCLGTFALIFGLTFEQGVLTRVLSSEPLRFIGLISYPLYLWHWVLLVFNNVLANGSPSSQSNLICVGLSFLLATLSYFFVEVPIRFKRVARTDKELIIGLSGSAALILSISMSIYFSNGLKFRFSNTEAEILAYEEYQAPQVYRLGECFLEDEQDFRDFKKFCYETTTDKPTLLIWGDSYAAHLYSGVKSQFGEFKVYQLTSGGCDLVGHETKEQCKQTREFVFSKILERKFDVVLLAADWRGKFRKERDLESTLAADLQRLNQEGVLTFVVGTVPEWPQGLPNLIFKQLRKTHELPDSLVNSIFNESIEMNKTVQRVVVSKAHFVDLMGEFCEKDTCLVMANKEEKVPIVWDDGHFTEAGSLLAAKIIYKQIERLKPNFKKPPRGKT